MDDGSVLDIKWGCVVCNVKLVSILVGFVGWVVFGFGK